MPNIKYSKYEIWLRVVLQNKTMTRNKKPFDSDVLIGHRALEILVEIKFDL